MSAATARKAANKGFAQKLRNPTHGSGWIVQMLSKTKYKGTPSNPTNGSWWIIQMLSKTKYKRTPSNPTNGSWWIVQMLSKTKYKRTPSNPTNGSWWIIQMLSKTNTNGRLRIPPTVVGGLFKFLSGRI